jgi:hypothetical protein
MSRPPTCTLPCEGRLLPVISSNSVVLPDPFGPITPTIAGASTTKSASSENVTVGRSSPRV